VHSTLGIQMVASPVTNLVKRKEEVLKIFQENKKLVQRLNSARFHNSPEHPSMIHLVTPKKTPGNVTYRYVNPNLP